MMRRLIFGLGVSMVLVVGARIYSHGPLVADDVVFIQLPELIEDAASEVGAKATYKSSVLPDIVPLAPSLEIKLYLKTAFAAIALEMTQNEYAEAYTVLHAGTNASLTCIFRGLGDQVIGIALEPADKDPLFVAQFKSALQRRVPAYAIASLPPNKLLGGTRER